MGDWFEWLRVHRSSTKGITNRLTYVSKPVSTSLLPTGFHQDMMSKDLAMTTILPLSCREGNIID